MATVPFEFDCNKSAGFVMDPNEHARVGWVTALDGFGLPAGALAKDLQVSNPMTVTGGKPEIMSVIGAAIDALPGTDAAEQQRNTATQ